MTVHNRRHGLIEIIRVTRVPGERGRAVLLAGSLRIPCSIGPSGMARRKREGDGATPIGRFRLLCGFYRPDRVVRPLSGLPLRCLRPDHGWCDDPASPCYNRPVRLPFARSHERLWRDDNLYDYVIVLDHNRRPRLRGCGSAIFFHVARFDKAPTAGCVAIPADAMRRLLARLSPRTHLIIG